MDQIYNSMLFMAQVPAERPAGKPAQSQESDSFQKQMEQASGKTEGKTETAVQDQPQEGPVTVEDSQELEKQMALAAMAVMQNPVVPVEQVTAPEETATRSPLSRLAEAACAVRALELVAIFMPMKPASMEKMPPVTKAKGVNLESICPPVAKARPSRMTNTTTKTLNTVVYCCFK